MSQTKACCYLDLRNHHCSLFTTHCFPEVERKLGAVSRRKPVTRATCMTEGWADTPSAAAVLPPPYFHIRLLRHIHFRLRKTSAAIRSAWCLCVLLANKNETTKSPRHEEEHHRIAAGHPGWGSPQASNRAWMANRPAAKRKNCILYVLIICFTLPVTLHRQSAPRSKKGPAVYRPERLFVLHLIDFLLTTIRSSWGYPQEKEVHNASQ